MTVENYFTCPACKERVRVGAKVCPHCHHSFVPIWARVIGVGLAIGILLLYWFYFREPISQWLGI